MAAARSWFGLALAALYAAAFVAAYWLWSQEPNQLMSDLWLMLAALPYTLTVRALLGSVDFSADSLSDVLTATAFCCALAYLAGELIEAGLRLLWRLAWRRPRPI